MTWTAHHPRPEPRETVPACLSINERSYRTGKRVELPAVLLAIVLGVLLGLALLHFMEPCAAGALC